jgi:hypothetical protein
MELARQAFVALWVREEAEMVSNFRVQILPPLAANYHPRYHP